MPESTLIRRLEFDDVADDRAAKLTLFTRPADGYAIGASVVPGRAIQDAAIDKLHGAGAFIWRYFRVFHIPDRYRAQPGSLFEHVGRVADARGLWLLTKNGDRVEYPEDWFGGGPLLNHCLLDEAACDELLQWTASFSEFGLTLDTVFLRYAQWMSHANVSASELADYEAELWKAGAMRLVERAALRFPGPRLMVNGASWEFDAELPEGVRALYENADNGGLDGRLGRVGWFDTLGRWLSLPRRHVLCLQGSPGYKQLEALRGWAQEGGALFAKEDRTADLALRMREYSVGITSSPEYWSAVKGLAGGGVR